MEFITEHFTVISVWIGFISAWFGAAKLGFKLKQALQKRDTLLKNEFKKHDTLLKNELKNEFKKHDALLKDELKNEFQGHDALLKDELKNEFQEHDVILKNEIKNEFQEHDVILKNEINQLEARRNIRIGELDAKVERILQILKNRHHGSGESTPRKR